VVARVHAPLHLLEGGSAVSRSRDCYCDQRTGIAPDDDLYDELVGKAIARAAEPDVDPDRD
jgi:hypothetical protein